MTIAGNGLRKPASRYVNELFEKIIKDIEKEKNLTYYAIKYKINKNK